MAFDTFKGFLEEDEIEQARGSDVGLGDYILDLPKGVVKGGSQAVQGLLQLGAMPIDYLANTNLLEGIEDIFEKITPETKTAVGDITSVLVQFGVPAAGAIKIASGLTKLKSLSQMTKMSSLPSAGAKGMELMKRAGFYGTISGATDFAVSTPGTISTLSDVLNITKDTDLEGLKGRERAAEIMKSKIKFGAEGTAFGAGVTLLPAAATLGFKYGIVPGAKVIGTVGGKALEYVNVPLQKGISTLVGKGETSVVQKGMSKLLSGGGLKSNVDNIKEFGRYIPIEGGFQSEMKRWFIRFKDQFTSSGPLRGGVKQMQIDFNSLIAKEQKKFIDLGTRIEKNYNDILNNFKFKLFDKGESKLIIQHESNKVHNYLKAKTKTDKKEILETIHPAVKKDVVRLKTLVDDRFKNYQKFIKDIDFNNAQALDYSTFASQRLGAFNNKRFKFNPLVENKAFDFFKARYADDLSLEKLMISKTKKQLGYKIKETDTLFKKTLDDNINKSVKQDLLNLKDSAIQSNIKPQSLVSGLKANLAQKGLIKEKTDQFPDIIRKLFSIEDGALGAKIKDPVSGKTVIKDIETVDTVNAVVDTVVEQSKQIYGKKAFDGFLKLGLDSADKPGFIFSKQQIQDRGFKDTRGRFNSLKQVMNKEKNNLELSDLATSSELFSGQYYAAPEIANALVGAKEVTNKLYDITFYKGLMTLKAGAQIAKTILSPVTQVRNFTTASVFPLASGLIGQGVGFKDAWRLTAGDVFAGAKTNVEKIAKIEKLLERGILDQNVQVQEMRRVLEKAQDGKISFNKMMKTPIMKTLTDIYQGADNYWKIYSDGAYQGLLRTAFGNPDDIVKMAKNSPKRIKLENKFVEDVREWFKTVADQDLPIIYRNKTTGRAFKSREEFLKTNKADDLLLEAENILKGGTKSTVDLLEDMSAFLTVNTIPTYSKVPRIIENIRNLPLGNFIAFPAEILRTTSNIISIGAKELTSANPYIRQMGARRLVGVSTVLGGLGTVTQKTAQYVTGVDEKTMNSFQRSFAPDYQKNSTLIPLTEPDSNGNFKYYNFSYSNPYDSLVAPVNAVLEAFADGKLNKDSVDNIVMTAIFGGIAGGDGRRGAITEFLSPFITESIGTERAADVTIRGGRTSDGKLIYYPQDNASVRMAKSLNHVIGGLTPGAFTSAQRIWDGATGRFTDYGTARDTKSEIAALMSGVRVEEAKPLSSMPFILTSFNRDKQNIRSKFSRTGYSSRSTPENKLAAYETYALETFRSQNSMFNTLNDAKSLGISRGKLRKTLEGRLTKTESNTLLRGRFKPPTYSKEAFNAIYQRLKREDPTAAGEIRRKNKTVQGIFDDLNNKLRRVKLGTSVDEIQNLIDEVLSPDVKEFRTQDLVSPTINSTPPQATLQTPDFTQGTTAAVQNQQANLDQRFLNIGQDPRYKVAFPGG